MKSCKIGRWSEWNICWSILKLCTKAALQRHALSARWGFCAVGRKNASSTRWTWFATWGTRTQQNSPNTLLSLAKTQPTDVFLSDIWFSRHILVLVKKKCVFKWKSVIWLFTACLFLWSCHVMGHRYLIPQHKGCLYLSLSVVAVDVRTHSYGNTKIDWRHCSSKSLINDGGFSHHNGEIQARGQQRY